eukprot:3029318-Rhodomonas_salina.1
MSGAEAGIGVRWLCDVGGWDAGGVGLRRRRIGVQGRGLRVWRAGGGGDLLDLMGGGAPAPKAPGHPPASSLR